jgi:hypothetical protein
MMVIATTGIPRCRRCVSLTHPVYVASDFAEGTGRLWWIALEMVIASHRRQT